MVENNKTTTVKEEPKKETYAKETAIEKFIFRGSELVSFQVAGKIVSLDELIAMGNNFTYTDTIKDKDGKDQERKTKIIVTDLGHGKYLSTKEKGENIERTFANKIAD